MYSQEHFTSIAALDLDPIKAKLMHADIGEGWSLAHTETIEREYRRFLHLMKKFPDEQVSPLLDVDVFWHYHILDTMKYAADCERMFGYFLHHSPDSGRKGANEQSAHLLAGARMQELYEATFGDASIRPLGGHAETVAFAAVPAEASWCNPAKPKSAWCSPSASKAAWCSPSASKAAWCSPSMPKFAWCVPAKSAGETRGTALNDSCYSRPMLAEPV